MKTYKLIAISNENHEILSMISNKIQKDLGVNITLSTVLNNTIDELYHSGKYDNFFMKIRDRIRNDKKKKMLEKMVGNKVLRRLLQGDSNG